MALVESGNPHYTVRVDSFAEDYTVDGSGISAAESHNRSVGWTQQIQPEMFVVQVQGVDLLGLPHTEVLEMLGPESDRPIQLVFGDRDRADPPSLPLPTSPPPLPPPIASQSTTTPRSQLERRPSCLLEASSEDSITDELEVRGLSTEESAAMLEDDERSTGRAGLPNCGVPSGSAKRKKGICGELEENCFIKNCEDGECVIA
jgi:hypothetical protein